MYRYHPSFLRSRGSKVSKSLTALELRIPDDT
jgi:hypothetical protein